LALVIDASVGLKWVLQEPDSHFAEALARSGEDLLAPDFWLNEASNVLWLQVRRKVLTPDEAREGLALLRTQVEPTPTADLGLHEVALDIGLATGHPVYDTLYVAFALAMGGQASRARRPALRGCHAAPSRPLPDQDAPTARPMGEGAGDVTGSLRTGQAVPSRP
jgi:predicted nucleic acid-binding protein